MSRTTVTVRKLHHQIPQASKFFPVLPFVGYWVLAALYYHFGFVDTQEIPASTHVYVFICTSVLASSYWFTVRNATNRPAPSSKKRPSDEKILVAIIGISAIGNTLLMVDKLRAGVTASVVIQQTEFLRDDYATSTLTTVAVPLAGFLYPAIAGLFLVARNNTPIPKWVLIPGLINLAALIVTTVLSGNRAHIAHFVLWLTFFVYYAAQARGGIVQWRRKVASVAIIAAAAFALIYTILISSFRVSTDFLQTYTSRESMRYDVTRYIENPRIQYGVVLLSGYVTQQFQYIDAILEKEDKAGIDPLPFTIWFERQLGRIGIGDSEARIRDYVKRANDIGLSEYGWPSMFGHAAIYYGNFGAIMLMSIIGWGLGYFSKKFISEPALWSLSATLLLYSFINYSYMAIPADHNFAMGAIVIAILRFLKI